MPGNCGHSAVASVGLEKVGRGGIPEKHGGASVTQAFHYGDFSHRQIGVADKDIAVSAQFFNRNVGERLHRTAGLHAYRGHGTLRKRLCVIGIYVGQDFPQGNESPRHGPAVAVGCGMEPERVGTMVDGKRSIAPVVAEHLFLRRCEIIGRDIAQVAEIGVQHVRIGQRKVYLVEIVENHLAPEHEFVEFGNGGCGAAAFEHLTV